MLSFVDGSFRARKEKENPRLAKKERRLLPTSTTVDNYLPTRLVSLSTNYFFELHANQVLGEKTRFESIIG